MRKRGIVMMETDMTEGTVWPKGDTGYMAEYSPNHPYASGGWVYHHRRVMERAMGRYLQPHESVHHKNSIKWDNRLENLELWVTTQPSGQRVQDRMEDAIRFLNDYNGFVPPPPRDELLWAAIDFDGTLCHSTWSVQNPLAVPGPPIEENLMKLWDLIDRGFKIVIHTSRGSEAYELIEAWCQHYGVHFDKIVTGKLLAKMYVDDRAVPADAERW
jgi:hypothetical protein